MPYQSIRILLVEDSQTDALLIQRSLRTSDRIRFEITSVETLAAARDAIDGLTFEVILLDLSLPDSSGVESVVSMTAAAPTTPIVVLSGQQDEETAIDAVRHGAEDFLTKGRHEADLLIRSIQYAMERKQLTLKLQRANDELEQRVQERTSELEAAQAAVRRSEEELAHAGRLNLLGEMASGLAHELNQPLMAIIASASSAMQRLDSPQFEAHVLQELLQDISSEATRAGEVIKRMRRMVRKREPISGELHLNNVVRDTLAMSRHGIEQRTIDLHVELADWLPVLKGDRIQIQQVVLNLLHNALEAIDADGNGSTGGSHYLGVRTWYDRGSSSVFTEVSNSGPGVDADVLGRLFDPFFTTRSEGLGLGLPICRSIVESHRGMIQAEAAEPSGMTFRFHLPTGPE